MHAVPEVRGRRDIHQPYQLSFPLLDLEPSKPAPVEERAAKREATVRLIEYSPFPRVSAAHSERTTYTQDISDSGMRIAAHTPLATNTMLHVVVRSIDGEKLQDALARVVWSSTSGRGGISMGLELVAEAPRNLLRARPTLSQQRERVA